MSVIDKINELKSGLTNIANAIREVTGNTNSLTLDEMPVEIENLEVIVPNFTTKALVERTLPLVQDYDLFNIEKIGDRAFYDCPISDINIPTNIKSIGYGAFENCELTSAILPFVGASKEDWRRYSNFGYIFGARSYNDNKNKVPTTLKNITINGGRIEDYAFKDCSFIESITLSNDIERIGNNAFEGCNFSSSSYYYENGLKYLGSETNPYLYLVGVFDNSITSAIINENCKFIGTNAFKDNTNLTNITIPNSVEFVGDDAFVGCTNLEYYSSHTLNYLGNSSNNFLYLVGSAYSEPLGIVIESQCKFIGSKAFVSNKNLTYLSIPSSVKIICNSAFDDCENLREVSFNNNIKEIGKLAFWNCAISSLSLPSSLERIDASAFKYNSLTSLTIPDNVKKIGESAFAGCKNLQRVNLGYGLLQVGDGAFSDCTSLSSVTIPASVKVIDAYAFQNCTSLKEITLPVQVESIERRAFANCTSLTTVTLKALIPPALVGKDEKSGNEYIGSFYGCSSLSNINVISNVETYYENSIISPEWSDYKSIINGFDLTEITEDDLYGITEIPANAFKDIRTLKTVTIPTGVTKIGDNAFSGCSSLTTMVMKSTTPPTLGTNAISLATTEIFVPQSAYNTYYVRWGYRSSIQCKMPYFSSSTTSISSSSLTGVKTIPANAFTNFKSLKSVTIPNTVISIGKQAFYGCTSLTSVTLSSNISTISESLFEECKSLTDITIPNKVTFIGQWAFLNSGLTSISLPEGFRTISYRAFKGCPLESITIPNSVTSIDSRAFEGCYPTTVSMPTNAILYVNSSSIKTLSITGGSSIPSNAFKNNTSLTSVSISNVDKVGYRAFMYCKNLYTLKLDGVKEIEESAFEMAWQDGVSYSNYTSLRRVNLGNTLETIGNYAFYGCTAFGTGGGMTELTLPATLKSIGKQAFKKWDYLEVIVSYATTPPSFTDGNSAFPSYNPSKYHLRQIRVSNTNEYRRTVGWSEYRDKEQQYNTTIFYQI